MTFWLALHRHDSGASEEKEEEKIPKYFEKAYDSETDTVDVTLKVVGQFLAG